MYVVKVRKLLGFHSHFMVLARAKPLFFRIVNVPFSLRSSICNLMNFASEWVVSLSDAIKSYFVKQKNSHQVLQGNPKPMMNAGCFDLIVMDPRLELITHCIVWCSVLCLCLAYARAL